jgi:hypothetical protein
MHIWNLDADRGLGYKQWEGTLPSGDITDEHCI